MCKCNLDKEEREKGAEKIFEEVMAKNFQNLVKDLNLQIL